MVLLEAARDQNAASGRKGRTGDEMLYLLGRRHQLNALSDIHASDEYRLAMTKVYAKRALTKAVQRAQQA